MTEIIQRKLNDSAWVRWTALILIALTMFFGYMFVDMMSPLQSMIEAQRGWTPDVFGMYGSSEFIFNVFGFLILAGIILDKMGVRFTGMLSASLMFIGACIKYYGVSDAFIGTGAEAWLNSWWVSFPASAKLASLGFMIFGCGMEMAGITVSKTIAKWFEGKEMALAMGLEMAIARVGVFAVFSISPWLANMAPATVVRPVGSSETVTVDVRILASTNQDLEDRIRVGAFRQDLFYRLNVLGIVTPPLRDRREDIPLLAAHFLAQACAELRLPQKSLEPEALVCLAERPWRGNVRELQNFVRRLAVFCPGPQVELSHLRLAEGGLASVSSAAGDDPAPYKQAKAQVLDDFTRRYVRQVLERSGGNISEAARISGIERVSLQKIIKRTGGLPGHE